MHMYVYQRITIPGPLLLQFSLNTGGEMVIQSVDQTTYLTQVPGPLHLKLLPPCQTYALNKS